MRGDVRLLLLSAVNWYEKYCEEKGDVFDTKEAISMVSEDCYMDLEDDEIDKLVTDYNNA